MTMYKSISAISLLALSVVSQSAVSGEKVTMCHNYGEISVSSSAVQAHLNHGDIEKEEGVSCPQRPGGEPEPEPETGDGMAVVVMVRCEGATLTSIDASFDYVGIEPADCPMTLADLLDGGLALRSVTGHSPYTDYLLIGEMEVEETEVDSEE